MSTSIIFDHGSAKAAQCFALFATYNIASTNTITVTRGTTSGASDVLSLSAVTCWPFTPLDGVYDGSHFGIIVVAPSETTARYTKIYVNTASYCRIGRTFVGPLFNPTYKTEVNNETDDWLPDFSTVERTENGADWAAVRSRLRSKKMGFNLLSDAETSKLHEMQRLHGITSEYVVIPDMDDRARTQQYGFLATARQLSSLEWPHSLWRGVALGFDERGGAP